MNGRIGASCLQSMPDPDRLRSLGLDATRSEAVRVRHTLQAASTDAPVHPVAGSLWLRLSAYAYNEIGDYERLATLLPGVLKKLGD